MAGMSASLLGCYIFSVCRCLLMPVANFLVYTLLIVIFKQHFFLLDVHLKYSCPVGVRGSLPPLPQLTTACVRLCFMAFDFFSIDPGRPSLDLVPENFLGSKDSQM